MLDYQTLDTIADAYTPLLAILSVAVIVGRAFHRRWKLAYLNFSLFLTEGIISYGLMYLDRAFQLWPSVGLDYSTHTAVALVLVVFLTLTLPRYALFWSVSLLCYLLLMLYQKYHSLSDIISTVFAVGILLLPIVLLFQYLGAMIEPS